MKRILLFFLVFMLGDFFSCDVAISAPLKEMETFGNRVSLINLIATPERYDGKLIFVTGYASIGFENMSICPNKNTLSKKDCIWINIDSGPYETDKDRLRYESKERTWKKYHAKVISVRGIFDKNDTGHLGGWSGAIKDIVDIYGRNMHHHFSDRK